MASSAAPSSSTTAPPPPTTTSSPTSTTIPLAALDTLTIAIYGLQQQIRQFATRLSTVEGHILATSAGAPMMSAGAMASGSGLHSSQPLPLGMPGFGGVPPITTSPSTTVPASGVNNSVPITQIQFPHSPSAIPTFATSPSPHQDLVDDRHDSMAVPRYHKLSFPTFDGTEDPLGWLNRCEHFFSGSTH